MLVLLLRHDSELAVKNLFPQHSAASYNFSTIAHDISSSCPSVFTLNKQTKAMDPLNTHASPSSFCVPVCRLVQRIVRGALTFVFGIVGILLGAVTGGLIGLATESGVFRGSGVGAISGAVFSMEVVESSLALWKSRESRAGSILYVIGILCSLCSGRLVREKVDPAMQSAVRSQMNAVDAPVMEDIDIFAIGGTEGMTRASVDRLPMISISMKNNVDASGESLSCAVCLQDFEIGETARILPHCQHRFHLPCIDSWLMRHGSCPLCRRDF